MHLHTTRLRVFSLLALLILTACGGRETPAPTMDPALIYTQAAQTVAAQLTATAAAQPTSTSIPTEIPPTVAPAPTSDTAAPPTQFLLNTPLVLPSPTLSLLPQATNTGALCNNSIYLGDVGTPDGAVLKPGQAFEKGWLLQNTGICKWDIGYYLLRTGGNTDFDAPMYTILVAKNIVLPGQIAEITLRMTAPKSPGKYEAFYQMYSNLDVPFGAGVSASIEVKK